MADLPPWITRRDGGVVIAVKAVPRASRTRAVALHDGRVRIQIAAPPYQGQSNAALQRYLAEAAGVRPSAARLHRGSSGARKLFEIDGDPDVLVRNLVAAFGELPEDA